MQHFLSRLAQKGLGNEFFDMMETKNDGKDASPPHRLAKQIVRPPSARGGKSVPE